MIPSSTYRLQIQRDFTLDDATGWSATSRELGRRGGLPVPGAAVDQRLRRTATTRSTPARSTRTAAARPGWPADRGGPRRRARRGGRHRAQPPGHLGPGGEPGLVGRAAAGPELGVRGLVRHRLEPGPDRAAGAGRRPEFELVDGELRYFEHRFPLAPGSWAEGDDPAAVHDRQHYELVHSLPRQHRAELPAVLRRHHAGRGAGGRPGGLRGDPRTGPAVAGRRGHRAADRPPGRAGRPGGVSGAAARDRPGPVDHRGEDPGGRRTAARRLAGLRHHRLRRHARGQRRLRRSGRRIRLHRALPAADRRSEVDRRAHRGRQADGGDRPCCPRRSGGWPPWSPR